MSAIWLREVRPLGHAVTLTRYLESRTVPRMLELETPNIDNTFFVESVRGGFFRDLYESSLQSWLYGATIELTQAGTTPTWSKDAWSFMPLSLDVSTGTNNTSVSFDPASNITVTTMALQARLECHPADIMLNESSWLTRIDFDNHTQWNSTNKPTGLTQAYALTGLAGHSSRYGSLICCANETDGVPGESAVGYWSNRDWYGDDYDHTHQNFLVARWVVGRPLPFNNTWRPFLGDEISNPLWIWPEKPRMMMVNCTPVIERAPATILYGAGTGMVYGYDILETPQTAAEAWYDNFFIHNTSIDYTGEYAYNEGLGNISAYYNVTARYETFILVSDALLRQTAGVICSSTLF
jgi:hypothetical protein